MGSPSVGSHISPNAGQKYAIEFVGGLPRLKRPNILRLQFLADISNPCRPARLPLSPCKSIRFRNYIRRTPLVSRASLGRGKPQRRHLLFQPLEDRSTEVIEDEFVLALEPRLGGQQHGEDPPAGTGRWSALVRVPGERTPTCAMVHPSGWLTVDDSLAINRLGRHRRVGLWSEHGRGLELLQTTGPAGLYGMGFRAGQPIALPTSPG